MTFPHMGNVEAHGVDIVPSCSKGHGDWHRCRNLFVPP